MAAEGVPARLRPTDAGAKRRIRRHVERLGSSDRDVAARAEGYLIRWYGARALEELVEACGHPDPQVRFRAVWALAYTRDARAYETILRLADDPDERVRCDATIALGILSDRRAVEPLKRMYLGCDVTRPADGALYRMGLEVLPDLIEVLRQGSAPVRDSVVQVVGRFAKETGDARCAALLEECLGDPDPDVRENAGWWLAELRSSRHLAE